VNERGREAGVREVVREGEKEMEKGKFIYNIPFLTLSYVFSSF
jgi:hypothetical protein